MRPLNGLTKVSFGVFMDYQKLNLSKLNDELNKFEFGVPFNPDSEDYEHEEDYYKSLSKEEMDEYGMGVCWDFTHYYGRTVPNTKGILFTVRIKESGLIENNHAFPLIEKNGKFYIAESAWEKQKGLYEFDTKEEAIETYLALWEDYVRESREEDDQEYDLVIYEYDCTTTELEGLSMDEWLVRVLENAAELELGGGWL